MNEHLFYLWRGAKVAAFMVAWAASILLLIYSIGVAGNASPKVVAVVLSTIVLLLVFYGLGRAFSEKPYAPVREPQVPSRSARWLRRAK